MIRRNFRDFAGRFSPISSFKLVSFLTVERFRLSFPSYLKIFSYCLTGGRDNGDENIFV